MTGEELERAIEFLLQSQANSGALISRREAAQGETDRQIQQGSHRLQQNNQQIDDLVSAQQRTQQQHGHAVNIAAELVEGPRSIRDDIGALVKLVGRTIERGGGAHQDGQVGPPAS
jgi:hypothetical protein